MNPGAKHTKFKIILDEEYFEKGDIVESVSMNPKLLVTSTPKQTWWRRLLQWITFGWYEAPWYYTVKIIK